MRVSESNDIGEGPFRSAVYFTTTLDYPASPIITNITKINVTSVRIFLTILNNVNTFLKIEEINWDVPSYIGGGTILRYPYTYFNL